jgi:lysylphosphatidylglycerol synthetase-like protein (DUF2156 family)
MGADSEFYHRAFSRVYRCILFLGVVVSLVVGIAKGWLWGLAFLLGAAAACLNFSWLHQAADALGPDARPTRKRVFLFIVLRYLLLGAGGYVIVKVFGMNAIAAVCGLLVPVAAILLEIIYELVHGT